MNAIWQIEGPRRALITGASGGIGEAFARILADEGWELALVARNEEQLHRVAGVLRAKYRIEAHVIALDLGRADAGQVLEEALKERGFAPDVVINNAGFGLCGAALELPVAEQLAMVDVNARALADLTLRFVPGMMARGRGGGVLNVASLAAFMPGPGMAVYFATKAFVLSFSEALAEELKDKGITISAFCPGPVRTSFLDRSGMRKVWMSRLLAPMKADKAAWAGWQGFKEGARVVVPGILGHLAVAGARILPRALMRKIAAFLLRPRKILERRRTRREDGETK